MNFRDLNLHPTLLELLDQKGFTKPTPIQERAIPLILEGKDIRASAQTGTGKTAAFLLPLIHRMAETAPLHKAIGPRLLILAPTRELAMQVAKEAEHYSHKFPRMKTVCVYGGAPYPIQRRQLAKPYDILVATPGRLIDHMQQGKIQFLRLETLVLDEADRMLDMGFIEPVETIAKATPSTRQTLLFSATLKGAVLSLSNRLMKNPQEISVIPQNEKHEHIDQKVYFANNTQHKVDLLLHLLTDPKIRQAIIFTSTKRYSEELAQDLRSYGHSVSALHGDMNQRQRARTLEKLRKGEHRFLVATDVAARGIDISTISHVYNFDLPRCAEDYTHRIGRTGRAGVSGTAASLASPKDRSLLKEIETFTKQKIAVATVPGMEPQAFEQKPFKKKFTSHKPFKRYRPKTK